jgi:drug/metabolite transporter (DMT)-like permease
MKKALFQLHAAVFLAGFTAVLGKLIALNEGLLVWYRLLLTVVTLGILLPISRQLQKISVKDGIALAGVGTILKRRINWVDLLLGLMAIAGIYIIFDFHPQYKAGILFGIVAAVGSALFPIFNKKLLVRVMPRTLTFYELGGGLVALSIMIPFYLQYFPAAYYLPAGRDWLWLLVLAWFCTILSFDLQLNALKKISAFTANLTYNLEPVYGIVLAFIFFHENEFLNGGFYMGLALIIAAVVLQMVRVAGIKN